LNPSIIAHTNAKARLAALQDPATVLPDETVDTTRTVQLGDTTLELSYVGRNHSDSWLVMRLPKEKLSFLALCACDEVWGARPSVRVAALRGLCAETPA
jgi:hypothetical protein